MTTQLPRHTRIAIGAMILLLLALAVLAWFGHDSWQLNPEGYP